MHWHIATQNTESSVSGETTFSDMLKTLSDAGGKTSNDSSVLAQESKAKEAKFENGTIFDRELLFVKSIHILLLIQDIMKIYKI